MYTTCSKKVHPSGPNIRFKFGGSANPVSFARVTNVLSDSRYAAGGV